MSYIVNLYYGLISISAYENMNFISIDLLYYLYPYTVNINLYIFSPYNFNFSTYCLNLSLIVTLFIHALLDDYRFNGKWLILTISSNILLNNVVAMYYRYMCCPFFILISLNDCLLWVFYEFKLLFNFTFLIFCLFLIIFESVYQSIYFILSNQQ